MNKNQIIYSFQYVAVLASMMAFSSCQKDEFTAEQALDLENQRKQAQRSRDSLQMEQEVENAKDLLSYAHMLDSLTKANAGGLVYYSVAVVPGGSSAFSGGGRYTEVGVNGVKVSIEQYGMVQEAETKNGLATFVNPLRSGEATVTVDADEAGYTSLSYVTNLTPDGGVPNDGTVYVGNVVAVFENDAANPDNVDKMAMISGKAFAELDLTNAAEESAPEGTAFVAVIDVNNPAFWSEYVAEANEEGTIHGEFGSGTKSGFIQRVAYEEASQRATVDANGDYSMMVSATASGLPIKMLVSDFAADRFFFSFGEGDGDDFGPTTARYLYSPNLNTGDQVSDFIAGLFDGTSASFTLNDEDAVVDVQLTETGSLLVERDPADGMWCLVIDANGATFNDRCRVDLTNPTAAEQPGFNRGKYVADSNPGQNVTTGVATNPSNLTNTVTDAQVFPPVLAFSAPTGGTQATGYLELGGHLGGADGALRNVRRIIITNPGAGYTSAAMTLTPQQTVVMGRGNIMAPTNRITKCRVFDSGANFIPTNNGGVNNAAMTFSTGKWIAQGNTTGATTWTLTSSINPHLAVLPTGISGVFTSANITYEYDFLTGTASSDPIGLVQSIAVGATGTDNGWTTALLNSFNNSGNPFRYFITAANFPASDGADAIFTVTGGALVFNPAYGGGCAASTTSLNDDPVTLAGTMNTFFQGGPAIPGFSRGASYVFTPSLRVTAGGAKATASCNVSGQVVSIQLADNTGYASAVGVSLEVATPTNSLRAEFSTGGAAIDNWSLLDGTGAVVSDANGVFVDYKNANPTVSSAMTTGATNLNASTNTYWVNFDDPIGVGAGAYGVPVFDATTPSAVITTSALSPARVYGVEILESGAGYEPGVDSPIEFTIDVTGQTALKVTPYLEGLDLTFTITNPGLGYSIRPLIYVFGGGVNWDMVNFEPNPTISTAACKDFDVVVNNSGSLESVTFVDANNNANLGLFDPTIEPLTCIVSVDEAEVAFAQRWADAINITYTGCATPTGTLAGSFGVAGAAFSNGDQVTYIGPEDGSSVAAFWGGLTGQAIVRKATGLTGGYISQEAAPNIIIDGFGSGATAEFVLDVNGGEILDMVITNGGSGYVLIETNHSSFLQPDPFGSVFGLFIADGEPFQVLGGPTSWEAYSGLQYVRDVHYGTGRQLDDQGW